MALPPPSVFVTHPDAHTAHATVDTLLYCPAAHAVQLVAPASPSVLVTDPDVQLAHPTVDTLLYCPAAHAVQLAPPACDSVSVTDPAPHSKQLVLPAAP